VGYLFVATTEDGWKELRDRVAVQRRLGVAVEEVDPARVPGLRTDDLRGAVVCSGDGVPGPTPGTEEALRPAVGIGVARCEHTDAVTVPRDVLVIACGASSPELQPELPIRPFCRQLVDVGPIDDLPRDLPMTIEDETTFHFRRRGDTLRLAMTEPMPRW